MASTNIHFFVLVVMMLVALLIVTTVLYFMMSMCKCSDYNDCFGGCFYTPADCTTEPTCQCVP